jgi:hypothetical protein
VRVLSEGAEVPDGGCDQGLQQVPTAEEQGQVDSMEHVAVLMREFLLLQDSSRNTQLPPSFHAERLLTDSFLPTIPV